jgi:sarcosine oxidase delta subunit
MEMMYVGDKMSKNAISKEFDCSDTTIANALDEHNIEQRSARQQSHIERPHAQHGWMEQDHTAYEYVRSEVDGTTRYTYVHALVAIANGADPWRLFSGDGVVHHENRHGRDNRPENLTVMNKNEHLQMHKENAQRQTKVN